MTVKRDPVPPPLDGSLTIPETLDFHWKHNPDLPIYAFSNNDGSEEATEISYLEFGRACHRVAHTLRSDRRGADKEVVAFIALTDSLLYQAITVGMMKAGLVPFPISHRNTPAAVVHLLKKTSCHRMVTTQITLQPLIDGVKAELAETDPDYELLIEEIPSLSDTFPKLGFETEADPFQPYPSTRPALTDLALYLHSSGSTGFPKAIPQTHKILVHWAAFPSLIEYRDYRPRIRMAGMALPAFHTLGVYTQVLYTLYGMVCVALYPPVTTSRESVPIMPTPDNILEHTRRTKSNAVMTVPALLQIWAQSKESVDLLKTLECVAYSGGSVVQKLGDFMVASGVRLNPGYGGTEFGSPTHAFARKGDETEWAWMEFDTRSKVRWVPQGDGTYECQFLTTETHSLPIENLPDTKGYATSDLWERHPTKDYLWRIVGRIDDVIIHSSGEKTVPAPVEDIIMSSPHVMGTVMFGREHDQPGILIEPKAEYVIDVEDQTQLAGLRNKLWSAVEEANKVAPAFSRIFKEMILITSKNKPLPRTGKGTVMRKMALKAYDAEIEALYATVESSAKGEAVVPPPSWTKDDVQTWLLEQAADIHPGTVFSPSRDLFEQGFDSLSATILRRRLVGGLRSSKGGATHKAAEVVTQNTVYNYPTIHDLTYFIANIVANPEGFTGEKDRQTSIEEMIAKYTTGFDSPLPKTNNTGSKPVVLLTGSTGNLGSQILASLLTDTIVERIYVLNRPSGDLSSIVQRHRKRFEDKALDPLLLKSERLEFVEGDTAQPNLGLNEEIYEKLRNTVTVIIHNAWRLDFNMSLSSFEPNVRGTRNLIDFSRSAPHASSIRFLFTSSVSSAQSWDKENGPFPEEVILDASIAVGSGYGESKYVTERILAKSGLQVSSLRIGQISGGLPNGAWATSDWLPMLVKSGVALGALPSAAGVVSWLPMDSVAKAILDIAFADEAPFALNLVHPRPVEWNTVVSSIREALARESVSEANRLRIVSFQEWFSLLDRRAKNPSDLELKKIPAIKLLEFFRAFTKADIAITKLGHKEVETGGLASFSTVNAQTVSHTIRGLEPIGVDFAGLWIKYWNTAGLFE